MFNRRETEGTERRSGTADVTLIQKGRAEVDQKNGRERILKTEGAVRWELLCGGSFGLILLRQEDVMDKRDCVAKHNGDWVAIELRGGTTPHSGPSVNVVG